MQDRFRNSGGVLARSSAGICARAHQHEPLYASEAQSLQLFSCPHSGQRSGSHSEAAGGSVSKASLLSASFFFQSKAWRHRPGPLSNSRVPAPLRWHLSEFFRSKHLYGRQSQYWQIARDRWMERTSRPGPANGFFSCTDLSICPATTAGRVLV